MKLQLELKSNSVDDSVMILDRKYMGKNHQYLDFNNPSFSELTTPQKIALQKINSKIPILSIDELGNVSIFFE